MPAETAETLLRKLVQLFGDRPYHALDLNGPYECVFCGAETRLEVEPLHLAGCIWPQVLKLVKPPH